jgi:branched-subunit amino acid transport protein
MPGLADVWPAVLGMALVTYGTRVGGLWLVSLAEQTPQLTRLLQHLGTGVLTALVVAGLLDGDAALRIGAVMAIVLMRVTGHMLTAIGGAAITAAFVRALLT